MIRRRKRAIFAIIVALVWILVRRQVTRMDDRFFMPSTSGIKGLTLYMVGNYNGAARAYRAHLMEVYGTEQTAADSGWHALLRGDFKTAETISKNELEKDPFAVGALLNLGEIALEKQAPGEAIALFNRILQKEPDQFDALLLSSVAQVRLDAHRLAMDFFKRALRTGDVESRITSFLLALETAGDLKDQSNGPRSPSLLAHYYRYLRIFDPSNSRLARAAAKEAIASGDYPDEAYLTLGVLYEKERKREKALSAILKAIEINPQNAEANRWAGFIYYKRGDLLNEYKMMKAAFEAAPTDPFYINGLNHVLVEQLGDLYEARRLLLRALEANPDNPRALERLGALYANLADYPQSIIFFQKAAFLEETNPDHHEGIGFALDRLGRTEEAIAAFQKSISISPDRAEPHSRLASIYHGGERYHDAIREYEAAFRLGEDDTNRKASLCALYHVVSKFQRSADCFEAVLKKDPRNTLARRLLPEVLNNLKIEMQK